MAVCAMCRKQFQTANGKLENYIGEDKLICQDCSNQIQTLLNSNDPTEVHQAVNYVYACQRQSADAEVVSCLKEMLENNASAVEELEEQQEEQQEQKRKTEPVQFASQPDYFQAREEASEEGGLFGNVGQKIKSVTKVLCWIGIIACVIVALALFGSNSYYNPTILPGFICLIVGPLLCWIGSLTTYAFGELVDKTKENNRLLNELLKAAKAQHTKQPPKKK